MGTGCECCACVPPLAPAVERRTVGTLSVVIGVSALLIGCARGPLVTVANNSGTRLTDVRLEFTGGIEDLETLQPAESKSLRVVPRGESQLRLKFRDRSGVLHDERIDTYFEAGYSGTLTIWIGSDFRVTWKDDTKVGVW